MNQNDQKTEAQEQNTSVQKKKSGGKGKTVKVIVTVLIVCLVAAALSLTQFRGIREAMEPLPVIGALPGMVEKIPVIGDMDQIVQKIILRVMYGEKTDSLPPYITGEHFEKPVLRTDEEIAETGLTTEDVLNAYDDLAWKITEFRWKRDINNWGQDIEKDLSAQFDKITVCNPDLEPITQYPFYGINDYEHSFDHPWFNQELSIRDTYCVNFSADSVLGEQLVKTEIYNMGIFKEQFEPVADTFGKGKFIFTEEKLRSLPNRDILEFLDFVGLPVYYPFEITRETIENATQEQLYLLYDMCKSLYSINVNAEDPTISNEDDYINN